MGRSLAHLARAGTGNGRPIKPSIPGLGEIGLALFAEGGGAFLVLGMGEALALHFGLARQGRASSVT